MEKKCVILKIVFTTEKLKRKKSLVSQNKKAIDKNCQKVSGNRSENLTVSKLCQMVVLDNMNMLGSGANQYLQPDYLSPLPTTVSFWKIFRKFAINSDGTAPDYNIGCGTGTFGTAG